ncbi:MAG TPA: hypothetical protein VG711_07985 [Phycisphaerales bacterium]|nr:hypothetical protein [Phycisphaerales bacterium]
MHKDDHETTKDLAIPTASLMITLVATLLAISGMPGAAAAVSVGAAGSEAIDNTVRAFSKRKSERELSRLKRLLETVAVRVGHLETTQPDEKVNLFLEVVRNAIKDDEETKQPIYSGILEWIVKDSPPSVQVRILSDAVRDLSYLELYYFIHEMHGRRRIELIEYILSESLIVRRLESCGLASGGVRMNGSPTIVGSILKKYCPVNELVEPKKQS